MKPHYPILKSNHYSSDRMSPTYKSGEDVYKEIGYNLDACALFPAMAVWNKLDNLMTTPHLRRGWSPIMAQTIIIMD